MMFLNTVFGQLKNNGNGHSINHDDGEQIVADRYTERKNESATFKYDDELNPKIIHLTILQSP